MIGGDEAEQNDSTDRYQRLQRVGIIRRLQPDRQTQPFVTKYAQYKPEQAAFGAFIYRILSESL